jgi:cobalt transporter subunit CbtA
MIGRLVLAALIAGLCAGLAMAAIQHARLTPLILQAEKFETGAAGHEHDHGDGQVPEELQSGQWAPVNGWQRTLSTSVSIMLAGAGFALLLAAVSMFSGIPISRGNSLIWGLCGFLAVKLAPAAGLPPELPGMPEADLLLRQVWWIGTAIATGAGLYLLATGKNTIKLIAAVAVIAIPHLIGAPQPVSAESAVPAALAAAFASNTLAAAAIFWCMIALFLSIALQKIGPKEITT